jgi:hypothetical protein
MHPAVYSIRNEIGAIAVRVMAYLSGVALLAIIAANLMRDESVNALVEEVRPREWVAASRPNPAFALAMAEFSDKSASYEIYRHPDGGRKDVMGWDFGSRPFARLVVLKPGAEPAHFGSAVSEIARETGLKASEQVQPAGVIQTKFGSVQTVGFSTFHGGEAHQCLGFAAPFDSPAMQISGWFCQVGPAPVQHRLVVCALDRLTLLSSGNDPKVADLFARAERKRGYCGASGPATANNDWVSGPAGPALRGRL